MLNCDFLIESIIKKKFFSLHPSYKIFEEQIDIIDHELKIFTKCYINISQFSFLLDYTPQSMKKNLFHTEIITHIFPKLKKIHIKTKPLYNDLYICESFVSLNDIFEIDSIIVNVEVKNSYKLIFKVIANHVKNLVKTQIIEDYSIILEKLQE